MGPSPWRPRGSDVRGAGRRRPGEVRPRPRSRRRAPPTGRRGLCERLNPGVPAYLARSLAVCSREHGCILACPLLHPPKRFGSTAAPKLRSAALLSSRGPLLYGTSDRGPGLMYPPVSIGSAWPCRLYWAKYQVRLGKPRRLTE